MIYIKKNTNPEENIYIELSEIFYNKLLKNRINPWERHLHENELLVKVKCDNDIFLIDEDFLKRNIFGYVAIGDILNGNYNTSRIQSKRNKNKKRINKANSNRK